MKTAMGISFLLVAVWWIVMSLPLLKTTGRSITSQ